MGNIDYSNLKILVACPVFEDDIKTDTVKSLLGLRRIGWTLFNFVKGYDVAKARNEIAKEALEDNYDYVLMVDSDIVVPQDTLIDLLGCNSDVAMAWYYRKNTGIEQTEIFKEDGKPNFTDRNNMSADDIKKEYIPFEIKGGGLGLTLIKTEMFKKLRYPFFKYVQYDNGEVLSEDNYFCLKVKENKGKIVCNPQLKANHLWTIQV